MPRVAIVGTGFVADLYAASLRTFPDIEVAAAYDLDEARLAQFSRYWGIPAASSMEALLQGEPELVLNLTNPAAHHEVSRACLLAGRHVYSEKPLAMELAQAQALHDLARDRGLQLASAPCNMLGQSAQVAWSALRSGAVGQPRLVYAELDDDFIPQAPVHKWRSESGAPWPVEDELRVGCTLEHAGYYLTWLMMMFGPVETVVAASAQLADMGDLTGGPAAPDYSSASLFFRGGVVARLTCSILAPHDHRLRIIGDAGILEVKDCWDNANPVRLRRRYVVRRRLVTSPIGRRIRPSPATRHPSVRRRGAAAMNFALGPAEMLSAISSGRTSRLAGEFALHLTEVSLAIQNSGQVGGAQRMRTAFAPPPPVDWTGAPTSI
jgi:predicted dehydrogenase